MMDHKEAINILTGMANKYTLDGKEKEAITTAVGLLSWGTLADSRRKSLKDKRDRSTQW